MARNSGVNVVKLPLGGINQDFASTVEDVAWVQRMVELHPAYFVQVCLPSDLQCAKADGKTGIILSFESVDMLEGKLDRIDFFRNLGVRVMQLSCNGKSPFAAGAGRWRLDSAWARCCEEDECTGYRSRSEPCECTDRNRHNCHLIEARDYVSRRLRCCAFASAKQDVLSRLGAHVHAHHHSPVRAIQSRW